MLSEIEIRELLTWAEAQLAKFPAQRIPYLEHVRALCLEALQARSLSNYDLYLQLERLQDHLPQVGDVMDVLYWKLTNEEHEKLNKR